MGRGQPRPQFSEKPRTCTIHCYAALGFRAASIPPDKLQLQNGARLPPDAKRVTPILTRGSPELSGGWGRGMQISYKWVPVVLKSRCTACGLCGSACPSACLGVVGGRGALVQPDACTSEGHCVSACQERAIRMRWMRLNGDRSIGQWRVHALRGYGSPIRMQPQPSGCGK